MDILVTFGELSEEISQSRKYAKWKATYINNCLTTGETPIPGPSAETSAEDEELNDLLGIDKPKNVAPPPTPPPSATFSPTGSNGNNFGVYKMFNYSNLNVEKHNYNYYVTTYDVV